MKKFLLGILLIALVFSSCSAPDPTVNGNSAGGHVPVYASVERAIDFMGTNPVVYGHDQLGRFIDGQIVTFYVHEFGERIPVIFKSYLVEYDALNPALVSYVDSDEEENNALFHHDYDMQMREDKKYVEFSIYSDFERDVPLVYELRIGYWPGDGFDGSWYAKSRTFNSIFTYDYDKGAEIDLGFIAESEADSTRTRFTDRDIFLLEGSKMSEIAFTLDVEALEDCTLSVYWKDGEAHRDLSIGSGKYYFIGDYDIQDEILTEKGQFVFSLETESEVLDSFVVNPHTDSGLVALVRRGEKPVPDGYDEI